MAEGHADMIGMVRALICDPELPNKAKEGKAEDIRYCIGCNQGCIARMGLGFYLGCVQNPAVGDEEKIGMGTLKPASAAKKVVVVGAGPAGLEAARVAALRKHQVVLLEKSDRPGGQNITAGKAAGRQEITGVTRWLLGELRKLDVDLRLGVQADTETVLKEKTGCRRRGDRLRSERKALPGRLFVTRGRQYPTGAQRRGRHGCEGASDRSRRPSSGHGNGRTARGFRAKRSIWSPRRFSSARNWDRCRTCS